MSTVATYQPEGNYYDKYNSRNPVARTLMSGFLKSFDELAGKTNARTAYEIGCGEGYLSMRLAGRGMRVRGSDISPNVIEKARENAAAAGLAIQFEAANIYNVSPASIAAELVVCCEVMEHLEDPGAALDLLARAARPWLLVSVPREPIWRALNMVRGSYWGDLGNTPGHVQHWSTQRFVQFLKSRVEVVETRRPLPWSMVLCRSRGTS